MQKITKFNVGGVSYTTTVDTLKQDPEGLLFRMVDGKIPTMEYDAGIFIDRDGKLFRHILDYLRNVTTWTPPKNVDTDALIREVDFFLLSGMKKILEPKTSDEADKEESIVMRKQHPILTMKLITDRIDGDWIHSVRRDNVMEKYTQFCDVDEGTYTEATGAIRDNMTELFKIGYRLKATVPLDKDYDGITYIFESKD